MPFLRIDAYKGRTPAQVSQLLDAIHEAVLQAFHVPPRDRYQLYQEHDPAHLVLQDTGLGIARSERTILVSVVSRPRPEAQKTRFYALLVEQLGPCGLSPADIVVSIVNNGDADWSFGMGRAQFLTGEL